MVDARSGRMFDPPYSGSHWKRPAVSLRGCHPLWQAFPGLSDEPSASFPWSEPHPKVVWAAPLSLAATDGIDAIFPFLGVLRCFNSPRVPPKGVRPPVARCCPCRVSPFRDPRIEAHFQLPEAYRR